MANLDKQEGVHQGIYKVVEVDVETPTGELVKARSYQIICPIEKDRRPSSVYMDVILEGARENGLPKDYIRYLEGIENNGYTGKVDIDNEENKIIEVSYAPKKPTFTYSCMECGLGAEEAT